MKINRRELIKLAAAAGLATGLGQLDVHAQARRRPVRRPRTPKQPQGPRASADADLLQAPRIWEPRWPDPLPNANPNEVVRLLFYGLSGISNRRSEPTCDIAFHDSGDSNHHHRLTVAAYSGGACTPVFNSDPDFGRHIPVERIRLNVDRNDVSDRDPRLINGASFFQPSDTATVMSRADLQNPKDFRWILDFESDYLYRKFFSMGQDSLQRRSGVYKPAFNVPYGIFHAAHRTGSTFRVQTQGGLHVSYLGQVADLIGANIYVKPNKTVTLNINRQDYTVQAPGEIYFFNMCFKNSNHTDHCISEPDNLADRRRRSDFYLQYKAFTLPRLPDRSSAPELELFRVMKFEPEEIDPTLQCFAVFSEVFQRMKGMAHLNRTNLSRIISDESPCAGSGYGGGGGIPPFPPT